MRVAQAGLCGTDLKIAAGEIPVALPRVLGHEMTGWVDRAGARGLPAAGTPVLVNPAVFCGHCALCRRDLPQLCPAGGLLGRDADGVFADLVAVDGACLHPLPPSLPADGAALLQVLSTCVHAQSLVSAGPAGSAVVVGLGVSGLLHVQLLRDRGVPVIVGVTRSAAKRELARQFGATEVAVPADAADAVAAHTGGHGAELAMRLAAPGGTVLVYGTTAPAADGLPTYDWYLKELTIRGTRAARPRDCDLAIRLYADRRVDLAPLVSARFPVGQAAQALAACAQPGQLKVVLDVAGQPA